MAAIFQHGSRNDLFVFQINSSDILFHSFSQAVLSEPIFGWEVAPVLFSKSPHIVYSRELRSGFDGDHKETPIIAEFFLAWFLCKVNHIFFVDSSLTFLNFN